MADLESVCEYLAITETTMLSKTPVWKTIKSKHRGEKKSTSIARKSPPRQKAKRNLLNCKR